MTCQSGNLKEEGGGERGKEVKNEAEEEGGKEEERANPLPRIFLKLD